MTMSCQSARACLGLLVIVLRVSGAEAVEPPRGLDRPVGQPADIASSAYQYRADRKAEENPPESWLALMRYSGQPLNKPVDVNAPAVRQVLCALLWEEIRPVQKVELTWRPNAGRRPAPENLTITTLDQQGSASSWWNNLGARQQAVKPAVSGSGRTFTYDLGKDTCGIVIGVVGGRTAADFDVPEVRAVVAETWKQMDIEIEWGYEPVNRRQGLQWEDRDLRRKADPSCDDRTVTRPRL